MSKSITRKKNGKKSTITKSEVFGWVFGVLSFIADTYAIIQIFNNIPGNTPISPLLGIIIWILALFTYFSLLHGYWKKNKNSKYSSNFLGYFFGDLIFYFKQPFALFPFILLFLLFFPVLFAISPTAGEVLLITSSILLFFFFIIKIVTTLSSEDLSKSSEAKNISSKTKKEILSSWEEWEKRIKYELSSNFFVTSDDFKDLVTLRNYGKLEFYFIFSHYASLHPSEVKYGNLFKVEKNDKLSLIAQDCLTIKEFLEKTNDYWVS